MTKKHLDNFYKEVVEKKSQKVFGLAVPIMLIEKHLFNEGAMRIKAEFNLLHSEIDVLVALYYNGKILSPTELYAATIYSSGGMTKILKKLQTKGYITRVYSPTDKRSLLVKITKEGEVITEKSFEIFLKKDTEAFETLDAEEQQILFKVLKKLVYSVVEKGI